MPRSERKRSKTGIYHVMVRGVNRQEIFQDGEDSQKYLEILEHVKNTTGCKVYGYCLMGNHAHLLIKEGNDSISKVMRRIGTSYVRWHNLKYKYVGHLFQDRYKSECVEEDKYIHVVIRYIHQNPVKAGMVCRSEDYKWSSCSAYYSNNEYPKGLTDTGFIFDLFGEDERAVQKFRKFMDEENEDKCLEYTIQKEVSDKEIKEDLNKLLSGKRINSLQYMERKTRNSIIHDIKEITGSSIRITK